MTLEEKRYLQDTNENANSCFKSRKKSYTMVSFQRKIPSHDLHPIGFS